MSRTTKMLSSGCKSVVYDMTEPYVGSGQYSTDASNTPHHTYVAYTENSHTITVYYTASWQAPALK